MIYEGVIQVQDGRENYSIEAKDEKKARNKIAKLYRVGESMVLTCNPVDFSTPIPSGPITTNYCPICGKPK